MRSTLLGVVLSSIILGGCAPQLSPPQMVADQSSEIAVREFIFAGQALAAAYGLDLDISTKVDLPRTSADPLGISVRPAIGFSYTMAPVAGFPTLARDRFEVREYFIKAGHHASQMICRNYLSGMRDRNEYFEFLQKEFNTAASLVQVLMPLTGVPEKSKDIFTQVISSGNVGADAYQTFKFLTPEIETILPLVEAAQVAMRDYFLSKEGVPATYAGALNAVSKIEYQCTRSGIRSILTKTLVQSKPQYKVVNGTLYSMEAKDAAPSGAQPAASLPKQKPAPAAVPPAVSGQ